MEQEYHPTVSIEFLISKLKKHPKIIPESIQKTGETTYFFVIYGKKPISKRTYIINFNSKGEVNFNQATALAISFNFIGDLMHWYYEFKDWKEGNFVVKENKIQ